MSDFKAKMHHIRFRMGSPRHLMTSNGYGSLQPSPDTLTRFKGYTSKAREGREGKRDGRGREKEEEGWRDGRGSPPPPFQIPRSATATHTHIGSANYANTAARQEAAPLRCSSRCSERIQQSELLHLRN